MKLLEMLQGRSARRRLHDYFLQAEQGPESLSRFARFQPLDKALPILAVDYVFVDIETSGLDAEHDQILSVAWVVMRQGRLDMSTAQHYYICQSDDSRRSAVNFESAAIHHITPDMLETGVTLEAAMSGLLCAAKGKRMVVHGACMEARFFGRFFQRQWQLAWTPILFIDTLRLEKFFVSQRPNHGQDLRLSMVRQRYDLATGWAHDALMDAVSTAELFLCQIERLAGHHKLTFGELCHIAEVTDH